MPNANTLEPNTQQPTLSLVLGGGGIAGGAWMTGWLLGLVEAGFDLHRIDRFVGTSAGATVAAQVSSDTPLKKLYERQVDTNQQNPELNPSINLVLLLWHFLPALLMRKDSTRFCQRIGAIAQRMPAKLAAARRANIERRLADTRWPQKDLCIIAIDGSEGTTACLTRHSDTPLVDAITASCAVPGVWPTVTIGQRWFIDGGVVSSTNANYALPCRVALALVPLGGTVKEAPLLATQHCQLIAIKPDKTSRKAIGLNPLNPKRRAPAARAGYAQGQREAAHIIARINADVS